MYLHHGRARLLLKRDFPSAKWMFPKPSSQAISHETCRRCMGYKCVRLLLVVVVVVLVFALSTYVSPRKTRRGLFAKYLRSFGHLPRRKTRPDINCRGSGETFRFMSHFLRDERSKRLRLCSCDFTAFSRSEEGGMRIIAMRGWKAN